MGNSDVWAALERAAEQSCARGCVARITLFLGTGSLWRAQVEGASGTRAMSTAGQASSGTRAEYKLVLGVFAVAVLSRRRCGRC